LVSTTGVSGTGARDRHNLAILSRFPISFHQQIIHDLIHPPSYRGVTADPPPKEAEEVTWERPFLACSVPLPGGRTLHVVNLHLRAPRAAFIPGQKNSSTVWRTVPGWAEGFFLAVMKRAGQALEVRLFIDQMFDEDPDTLIVVAGDFNSEVYDIPVRMIRGDEEDTGNGALMRRMLIPLEHSLPDSRRYSVIHSGRPLMLDHLLASQALMSWYRTAEIHNEALGDEMATPAVVSGAPESYHAPMVAEFQFPGEEP
ncbi:MAG: endonuclease, partial [Rhodospirillales bacterium]|nr:endonuclease [Rhodospirillales bacterium]